MAGDWGSLPWRLGPVSFLKLGVAPYRKGAPTEVHGL